jgi:uncharacterized protein
MKSIDLDDLDKIPGIHLKETDTFSFRCHPDIACFNQCCRNLNLFLYPYDVIRLKNRLGISSDQFLDTHVDVVMRDDSFFPEVLLRMSDAEQRLCPFLSTDGCTVYPDRPDTCRCFPVEVGVIFDPKSRPKPVYFFRPADFCMGQHEKNSMTPRAYFADQQAEQHQKMTLLWAELKQKFQVDPWGSEGPHGRKGKMAFMAAYNVDRFRDFIFNSTFLKRYKIQSKVLKKIRTDDAALMKLGFEWIAFFLWGIRSKNISPR